MTTATEREALDAYSTTVTSVAERVLPAVASLRVGRPRPSARRRLRRRHHLRRLPHHVGPRRRAGRHRQRVFHRRAKAGDLQRLMVEAQIGARAQLSVLRGEKLITLEVVPAELA